MAAPAPRQQKPIQDERDADGVDVLPPGLPDDREYCGDLDIRIDRDGTWYYHGSPIGRKELVCLFASVLWRDEAGDYWMITPTEMGRVEVEDVPFAAVEMFVGEGGDGQCISFRTSVDDLVTLDAEHPLRIETDSATGEPSPYVMVRDGMEARLSRSVFYELVELGVEREVGGETLYGVWSNGMFFPMGKLDGEETP